MSDSDKADPKIENPTLDVGAGEVESGGKVPGEKLSGEKKASVENTGVENSGAQSASAKEALKNAAPKPPQKKAPAAPRVWPAMFALTLFASALGAGIATYYWTSPAGNMRLAQLETRLAEIDTSSDAAQNLRGDLNAVDARLGQIESRVTALENAPTTPSAPPALAPAVTLAAPAPAPTTFDPRVAQLAERLSAIENAVPADLAARLNGFAPLAAQAALVARVTELEQSNNGETLVRAGRILALSDLARMAAGSEPFPIAVETAATTLPGDAVLNALRPHATQGAPTPAQLSARFPEAARQALAADRAGEEQNIIARLWNQLASLISIRRVGNVEGDDNGARLARAEAALDREDLAASADEVAAMQGAASQSMGPWLEDARARLAIETAVAGINARIVQMLASQDTNGQNAPNQNTPNQNTPANAP